MVANKHSLPQYINLPRAMSDIKWGVAHLHLLLPMKRMRASEFVFGARLFQCILWWLILTNVMRIL